MNHDTSQHDRNSLYKAVTNDPTDLDARKVYADFLTEQQDPRGEFILHQFAMEESPQWSKTFLTSKIESERLLNEHREEWEVDWINALIEHAPKPKQRLVPNFVSNLTEEQPYAADVTWNYRCGFIDKLRVGETTSPRCIAQLRAFAPIRALEIDYMMLGDKWRKPDLSHLEDLVHLNLSLYDRYHKAKPKKVFDVFDNLNAEKLESLKLKFYQGRTEAAKRIAETDFPSMKLLDLGRMDFSGDQLATLANSNWFSRLQHLSLVGNRLGKKAVSAIKNSRVDKVIKTLNLKVSSIGDEELLKLASDGFLQLERLGIGWWFKTNPGPEGVKALFNENATPNLRSIDFNSWEMDNNTLSAFLNSETGTQVSELAVPDLKDEQALRFAQTEFDNLESLNLKDSKLSGQAIEQILLSPLASNLHTLILTGAKQAAISRHNIFETPAMDSLLYLDLSYGAISNRTMKGLTKSSRLSGLLGLNLLGCKLNKKSFAMLARSKLDSLKYLRLPEIPGGSIGRELKQKFGSLLFSTPQFNQSSEYL